MVEIDRVAISAYVVPTVAPESDGTAEWKETTLVVAELGAAGETGLGYTYADTATARLAQDLLAETVRGKDPLDTPALYESMIHAVRNHGRSGVSGMAISALDVACWDLKAKLLRVPLAKLLGLRRPKLPAYGSGGFTSLSEAELQRQLGGWIEQGFSMVKMKVGRDPQRDLDRVRSARKAIGRSAELFVDANGAYDRKQALAFADRFAEVGVTWFEEPVVRTDVPGLRLLRDRAPAGMEIAGGEYGYEPADFRVFLEACALDVVQADATRCGGITGFLRNAALIEAYELPMSSHCAPALHVALGCAVPAMRHLEWFSDHVRIEQMLFEGAPRPDRGQLQPDLGRAGLGLSLERTQADKFRVSI
ncbi:MAG TPA: enolase C-terminal domain-like protein [Myxococcales bacterium]|nr:enolase C-terminal domain-like protein [Myxococcales bacterium]